MRVKLVLASLAAGLVGFALGIWTWRALATAPERSSATERVVDAPSKELAPVDAPSARRDEREPRAESAPAVASRVEEGLISAALRRYALDEIDAGWHELRKDALPEPMLTKGFVEFEEIVRAKPREIGRELAGDATQREQLASDDPFAVIDALRGASLGPQPELVQDEARMRRFFACDGGPRIDGAAWIALDRDARSEIAPGTTFVFPPGTYDVRAIADALRRRVRCVSIVGAGMDRTLLRGSDIQPNEPLDRFELRDCTFESSCDAIDLSVAGVWRAERVRFVGFDCGAGGCGVFYVGHGAILELESCRIEAGFGRNPGDGCLFDVRTSAMVARLHACTIRSVSIDVRTWPSGVTVLFDGCRLEDLPGPVAERGDGGIALRSTTVGVRASDAGRVAARKLSEINPAW